MIFFIFFKISEHRAIKTWAHFYKIKYFKIASYDNMSVTKVVLLFTYWKKKIIFRELQLIFDTKNWVWKSKNALFWWLGALSFCQIWKNLLVPMNVDLKDYLILGASLGNVFPWITIWSNQLGGSSSAVVYSSTAQLTDPVCRALAEPWSGSKRCALQWRCRVGHGPAALSASLCCHGPGYVLRSCCGFLFPEFTKGAKRSAAILIQ